MPTTLLAMGMNLWTNRTANKVPLQWLTADSAISRFFKALNQTAANSQALGTCWISSFISITQQDSRILVEGAQTHHVQNRNSSELRELSLPPIKMKMTFPTISNRISNRSFIFSRTSRETKKTAPLIKWQAELSNNDLFRSIGLGPLGLRQSGMMRFIRRLLEVLEGKNAKIIKVGRLNNK